MTKFEIAKREEDFRYKDRKNICEGCTFNSENWETVETFDTKEQALKALEKYQSDVSKTGDGIGTLYEVTEYLVAEMLYDDDGEFLEYVGTWEFAPLDLAIFQTWEDTYSDLKELIGEEFDNYDVSRAFLKEKDIGANRIRVERSYNENYDYLAYADTEISYKQFLFTVDEDNVITDVRVACN